MKHIDTWILIADGGRARLVTATKNGKLFSFTEYAEFSTVLPPNRKLQRDAKPRTFESQGAARHAIEPKSDPHRELKRHFAEDLAEELESIAQNEKIESLVIAAAPTTLGDLRNALSPHLRSLVRAEAAIDLTKVPNSELAAHLHGVLPK